MKKSQLSYFLVVYNMVYLRDKLKTSISILDDFECPLNRIESVPHQLFSRL